MLMTWASAAAAVILPNEGFPVQVLNRITHSTMDMYMLNDILICAAALCGVESAQLRLRASREVGPRPDSDSLANGSGDYSYLNLAIAWKFSNFHGPRYWRLDDTYHDPEELFNGPWR